MSKKIQFFTDQINPNTNFIIVMLCLIPFLFQKSILLIFIQVLLFFILQFMKNGKVRILPSVIIILTITFFSLLSPIGKVLFSIGHFPVTLTALNIGLRKGLILTGMVMISKFAMGHNLHFPGKLGVLSGTMFSYLNQITAMKISLKPDKIITSIDDALLDIFNRDEVNQENEIKIIRTTAAGKIFLIALAVFSYILFLLN